MREQQLNRHPWCRDVQRDNAVRAAEDGRQGPLPTLAKAIAAVTERRPVDAGGGGNVTGMRTERVTLEITHDLDSPLGEWIFGVVDESFGYDETVRVVDNTAERMTQALTADRFASAVAEAEALRARVAELESQLESVACRAATAETALESAAKLAPAANADTGSNHAEAAKCSPSLRETGECQSRLRTELVTLEVTHAHQISAECWDWRLVLGPGESVRVVEEVHFDDVAQVAMERDAAIRERDKLRGECLVARLVEEIKRFREERRWIPVGERLPELLQNVLVCSSRGIHFASLDSCGQWLDEDENPGKKITHWQPLPPGPEAAGTELPTE